MGRTLIHSLDLRNETDVVLARRRAREIAERLGFDVQDQTRIATACSEIARNAVRYASGGQIEFEVESGPAYELVITTRDHGPGIKDVRKVLSGRFRSTTGMGLGIVGAKRLMDGFDLQSKNGAGTTVTLSKKISGAREISQARLAEIASELQSAAPDDTMREFQQQNRDLLRTLDQLRERQAELERLNQELDDTNRGVVALYAELDERAGFLQRASELKSRFLSNMSHEFRTPLNSILSLCLLLIERVDGDLTPEQEKQVVFIRRSAESLLDLVNDLLDIAKIEAGKIIVHAEEFSVPSLFGALRGMLRPLITNPAVVLTFEDAAQLPPLVSDESKVSQILRNFISNALKFTERGEVRVTGTRGPHDSIIFAVQDTGIGIAAEDQSRIFEEFTQVDNPLQKRTKGTGLGLPLTRKLAELLGGHVAVQSEFGRGSTFTLTVPRLYSESSKVLQQGPSAAWVGGGSKLLIVDDEEVARYILRSLLPAGFHVMEAPDGRTGLALARDAAPDVIFLDLMMPDYSGYDFLKDLRANAATSGIPVIIHTSKALDADERVRLLRDAIDVVPKESHSREASTQRIRSALEKAGAARTAAEGR